MSQKVTFSHNCTKHALKLYKPCTTITQTLYNHSTKMTQPIHTHDTQIAHKLQQLHKDHTEIAQKCDKT